ncbi:hypothetical protein [Rhodanobacter lindaniclasticus]
MNIASAPSRISAGKPPLSGGTGTCAGTSVGSAPSSRLPSASIAPSLNSDSNAIASTRPRLCAMVEARRVPNSIANKAISKATYKALSCQGSDSASWPWLRMP